MRQLDQHEPVSNIGRRRSIGLAQPHAVGRRSVDNRQGYDNATPTLADRQHSQNDRFVREIEAVRDFLMGNAIRLTRQRADAEDLVQETLLKAYASFHGFHEGTQLKSWLARIMANTWIDRYRATQRRPAEQLGLDITDMSLASDASRARRGEEAKSAESKALQALPGDAELALCQLPLDLREIVYYACIAGYRNTEIAAMLGIPAGTVGSKLHRGKAMLRDALTDLDFAAGDRIRDATKDIRHPRPNSQDSIMIHRAS
ncbi:sigma-70 family RNA polymerase sigma factor [Mycolicibacterium goodii]|uniref:sigma-70 family RNA polymerase sigma factor n=1 Tax=Mycolicibacterium goodii TaxID=134601 RepID=UPI0009FB72F5